MSTHMRFALLALVCCAVLVAGARHASAAAKTTKAARFHTRSAILGEQAVKIARRYLGVRYVYGGSSPRGGFDCSGLVRYVFSRMGIALPHSSYAQFGLGHRVARGSLRPGDLVFFDGIGHVGIYIGGGRFIHAPHTGTRVSISSLGGWYSSRYDGARRLA